MQSYSQDNILKQFLYKYKTNSLYTMSRWMTQKYQLDKLSITILNKQWS